MSQSRETGEYIRAGEGTALAIAIGLIGAQFTGGMSLVYTGIHIAWAHLRPNQNKNETYQ